MAPRLFPVLLSALWLSCLVAEAATVVDSIEPPEGLLGLISDFEQRMADPAQALDTKDLTAYARYVLVLGRNPALAEAAIRRAFRQQIMDLADPDFGNVLWRENRRPRQLDLNGTSFTFLPLGEIFRSYGDKLSLALVDSARPHVAAAIRAIKAREVPVTYTNIFVKNAACLILLGEAFGDKAAAADGLARLDRWLAHTASNGVTEFNSPTYAAVTLGALQAVYRHAAGAEAKEAARKGLEWLWTDLAANFFPAAASLSGPFSRTYDIVSGRGGIDMYFRAAGLSPHEPPVVHFDTYRAWSNRFEGGYVPSAQILALARSPEKFARQRCGDRTGQDRTNFITGSFALGSASMSASTDDRQVACDFADPRADFPDIRLVGDVFDSPYGRHRVPTAQGHSKIRHLLNRISCVQEHGLVLALVDWEAGARGATESVATNFLFPLEADAIYVDGVRILPSDFGDLQLSSSSVVGVRHGAAVVALKIFAAYSHGKGGAHWFLKADGGELHAGRFGVYHYRGEPLRVSSRPVRAGLLVAAGECSEEEEAVAFLNKVRYARIRETVSGTRWDARVEFEGTKLEAGLDSVDTGLIPDRISGQDAGGTGVIFRLINGRDFKPPVFEVNGRDFASEIMNKNHSAGSPATYQ